MSSPELLSDFGAVDAGARADARRAVLWDVPLRVFHWSLAAAVTTAIVTGELGGAWMPWHGRAGLLIVGLLVFRVLWGVLGSATSRFTQFAPTPSRLLDYLRGRWRGVGHNPLGALSVFALLGLLSLQAATGLFGSDDIAFAGPLNHLVDDTAGARATGWHRLLADGLIALVALHLLAIAFHVIVKRHRLIRPMVTGRGELGPGQELPRPRGYGRFGLLSAVAIAAVAVLALAGAGETPVANASAAAAPVVVAAPAAAASTPAW
ncbi:MAG TPA: cytochrome b/b6 domain-containing protein [Burkholderiaceae bacterium]|jgi:cytochrome b|nr:cytochrome b/b6 domain-containing protein [Burkholderiaceae bacterium]